MLLVDRDGDFSTSSTEDSPGIRVCIIKIRNTVISAGRQVHVQSSVFNFAADGDSAGTVDFLVVVLAYDIDDLRIVVDFRIDDKQIAL